MTPSKRRRQGREAFCPGDSATEECPCTTVWDRENWIDGWQRAQAEYEAREAEKDEKESDPIRLAIVNAHSLEDLKDAVLELYDARGC